MDEDHAHAKAPVDSTKQAALLETLRYKQWLRHGAIPGVLQTVRRDLARQSGLWYYVGWLAALSAYAGLAAGHLR